MTAAKALVTIAAAVIVAGLAARKFLAGHRTPAGQPPLANLAKSSLDPLKTAFNRAAGDARVILLLSPS